MLIDIFSHIFPKKFINSYTLLKIPEALRFVETEVGNNNKHFVDLEVRMKLLDKYGISMQVISLALMTVWPTLSPKDGIKLARLANDEISELVGKYPERLIGVATLPYISGDALDELDRSIRDLGLRGVQIPTNIYGRPLDDPEFIPFYDRMVKYDLPVLLHPMDWKYYEWIYEQHLSHMLGWPIDTSIAMARLVFGGVMARYPNLKIVVHHLGGMIPYFALRIKGMFDSASMRPELYSAFFTNLSELKKDPLDYFRMIYADTMVHGWVPALECGLKFFGADHVVFATDYPFGPEKGERFMRAVIDSVRQLNIPENEKKMIFEENARKLLKLP